MQLTPSFLPLLLQFSGNFTQPTCVTFMALMTGWLLSHRHRFITELIQSSASTHTGHHSRYHRFFSHAAWSLDAVGCTLARFLVVVFAPTGLVTLAIDDTLCRKRGLNVYGTGMHYDPLLSSKALKVCSWGHDWVVLCLLVRYCPWAPSKVWALPLLFRLYRNRQGLTKGKGKKGKGKTKKTSKKQPADPNHRTRPELARELIALLAGWFPDRQFVVSGDSAYGGKSVLQHLPNNVDLLSRVVPTGVLYAPAPAPLPTDKGRPRKKGMRLGGMAEWAADASQAWQELVFDQFGLHATLQVKTRQALYYGAGKDRLLTVVLVRDVLGKRPDQMFYCTCLSWDARTLLSHYSARWAIEVTFENAKQLLGLEDAANRLPKAVLRTAPWALLLYSLVVAWYHLEGHPWERFPDRPWYRRKKEPSFADMLSTLRRRSWESLFAGVLSEGTPAKKSLDWLIDFASRAG
jgi:DDE superfamily endonuclease